MANGVSSHSHGWRCCFGCRCQNKIDEEDKTNEKVQKVSEISIRVACPPAPKLRPIVRSIAIENLRGSRNKDSIDVTNVSPVERSGLDLDKVFDSRHVSHSKNDSD